MSNETTSSTTTVQPTDKVGDVSITLPVTRQDLNYMVSTLFDTSDIHNWACWAGILTSDGRPDPEDVDRYDSLTDGHTIVIAILKTGEPAHEDGDPKIDGTWPNDQLEGRHSDYRRNKCHLYALTKDKFLKGLAMLLSGGYHHNVDMTELGSADASDLDSIVQLALFGELIFN